MVAGFLSYVEIKTKITSLFAFLMAAAFLFYKNQSINWKLTAIFFASMFLFDLTTTSINNYIDTKTNKQKLQFKRKTALIIIYVLLGLSTFLGLLLVYYTDIVVLLTGGLCFICGILYTYGPVPISRQPWGEILSGVFYGFLIPFLILYINMPAGTYILYDYSIRSVSIQINIMPFIELILLSTAPVCATANIMLANNICDLEKDILVKRYTLPYYLGHKALYLFAAIYYLTYLASIAMVVLDILPPLYLLSLLTIFIVQKNIKQFIIIQDKGTTFMVSIRNYIIIMTASVFLIFICGIFT